MSPRAYLTGRNSEGSLGDDVLGINKLLFPEGSSDHRLGYWPWSRRAFFSDVKVRRHGFCKENVMV